MTAPKTGFDRFFDAQMTDLVLRAEYERARREVLAATKPVAAHAKGNIVQRPGHWL